jgi:hypothetical protein
MDYLGLSIAKIPSGRKSSLIFRQESVLEGAFDREKGRLVATDRQEDTAKSAARVRWVQVPRIFSSTLTREVRSSDSGGQIVTMMRTAELGHGYDLATCTGILFCRTTGGRSLRQRKMSPILVVVADVLIHQAFQMAFIENDHMVEQIATAVANPSFGNAVLQRTAEAGLLGLEAEVLYRYDHFFIEMRTAIKDQMSGSRVVRECLAQLLNAQGARRILCHIAVKDAPPVKQMTKKQ